MWWCVQYEFDDSGDEYVIEGSSDSAEDGEYASPSSGGEEEDAQEDTESKYERAKDATDAELQLSTLEAILDEDAYSE